MLVNVVSGIHPRVGFRFPFCKAHQMSSTEPGDTKKLLQHVVPRLPAKEIEALGPISMNGASIERATPLHTWSQNLERSF